MTKPLLGAGFAALVLAMPAQAVDVAVGARISTLGLGLEAATGIAPDFNLRAVINGFNYDQDFEDDQDNEYEARLKLFTLGVMADYHPFGGVFRLTGGALSNGFKVSGIADRPDMDWSEPNSRDDLSGSFALIRTSTE